MPITHKACLPLCRTGEPSFVPKMNCRFDVPASHLPPRYTGIGEEVLESLNDEKVRKIPVKSIKYPNLGFLKKFDKHCEFSPFIAEHMKYAKVLIKILDSAKDVDELISLSLYCRDQCNKQLFVYAYSVVLVHRYDSDNIEMPQQFEIAPTKFFSKGTLTKVKQTGHEHQAIQRAKRQADPTSHDTSGPEPIEIKFRGTMNVCNPEEKLSYFREDLGANSHHWHWHIVYPGDGPSRKYYDKHRRGELFYYMHHQMLNWYDCNRLSQGVHCLMPFDNFRETIKLGYFPNMTTANSSYIIPSRQNFSKIQDLERDSDYAGTKIMDMERWYNRLQEAIDNGYCIDYQGKKVDLLNDQGVETLFNMIEANPLSKNLNYYGDLHNAGHNMISLIHDPCMKYKEPGGVMSDTTTALRDPIFYRWHKMCDDLGVKLKNRLPRYTDADLTFSGIKIKSFDFVDPSDKVLPQLTTFWQRSIVNLQNGLDFHANVPSLVAFTHLNYQQFTYLLKVENTTDAAVQGTVRIFFQPVHDEKGERYLFEGSRSKAVEVDRFLINLPPGLSKTKRKSSESAMTIPFERTYPMQKDDSVLLSDQPEDMQAFCMCGWPQNMMLPKGTPGGYTFRCFIMITNYNQDKVDQPALSGLCIDNYILCGARNRKYPDNRPMGFPFDRPADEDIWEIDDFVYKRQNMIYKEIKIHHLYENKAQVGNDPNNLIQL